MCIEHRWAARQPAVLPVSLKCRSIGLVRGRLRNISNGGALVQAPAPLPPNAPVEVILPVHPGPSAKSYRLPAIVTRSDKNGIGLMFDRVEPEMWVALLTHLSPVQQAESERVEQPTAAGIASRAIG